MLHVFRYDSIHQLMIGRPDGLSVNVFLVEEADGLTVIDTAIPAAAPAILHTVERLRRPITRIILTHAHHDHVGSLDRLKEAFPHAEVSVSRRESRLLAGNFTLDEGEDDCPIQGQFQDRLTTRPERIVEHGDQIGSLLVIAAPGHTPGSIALFDERSRSLFSGDAFQSIGGLAVAGQLRPEIPMHAHGTWSRTVSLASALVLRSYEPALLFVGHGPSIIAPRMAIDTAIDEAEESMR